MTTSEVGVIEVQEFVNTRHMFPDRGKVFLVTGRHRREFQPVLDVLNAGSSPAEQQQVIQELVEQVRPLLHNCIVYSLTYSPAYAAWEIGVSHPALPEITYGTCAERENLIPETPRRRKPVT